MVCGLLLILGAISCRPHGVFTDTAALEGFWRGVLVMGAGFALSWRLVAVPPALFWCVAIGARLLLFPMEPGDDIWRYLWEGKIQLLGYSPYHLAPDAPALLDLRTAWWVSINHPDVTAIYPPLAQLLFRGLAAVQVSVPMFKGAFVAADLGVCLLLCRCFGCRRASLYAWNPLVLYSFSGGGHYDSVFLLAVVFAWLLEDGQIGQHWSAAWLGSALLLGISVALKWISLPLLGFLVWRFLRQRQLAEAALSAGIGMLPFGLSALAFCGEASCPLIPTSSQFVTRGRNAEFIPHLIAQIWPSSLQSNAPYGVVLLVMVALLALRSRDLDQFVQMYWPVMLLLSPIIHVWYFTWWIPFGVPGQSWAIRMVSLSGFLYFPHPATPPNWYLNNPQRLGLWLPPILAGLFQARRQHPSPIRSDPA